MDILNDSELNNISQNVKPLVWVIRVSSKSNKSNKTVDSMNYTYATGFAIKNEAGISIQDDELLLLTCAHSLKDSTFGITARRVEDKDFVFEARVLIIKKTWDVALLAVKGIHDITSSEFEEDGSIATCQTLVNVCHSMDFVWSVFVGRAVYPCVNHFDPFRRNESCGVYYSSSLNTTPEYRILGHIWNVDYFRRHRLRKFEFEKNMNPFIPIIQCTGFLCKERGPGGPVFNTKGKVVGMIISEEDGSQIAIHMSLLKEFIASAPDSTKDSGRHLKRKDLCQ